MGSHAPNACFSLRHGSHTVQTMVVIRMIMMMLMRMLMLMVLMMVSTLTPRSLNIQLPYASAKSTTIRLSQDQLNQLQLAQGCDISAPNPRKTS